MKKRPTHGRGLFYSRDSLGRHETTPPEYVLWACHEAKTHGVSFRGTPEQIEHMIRANLHEDEDLFFDYGITGNILVRPGLEALFRVAQSDSRVSHVFIPRRDRLARPDFPVDGLLLENQLRAQGITIVFRDRVVRGQRAGGRPDISEAIMGIVEYDKAAKDLRDLAEKMVSAQITLAKWGNSTGGRAPYGFRRHLAKSDGTLVRQLLDGEYVKMAHHHVVWYPGPEEELSIIRRILELLEKMPASRVAAILNSEGVRTPDFGRERKDHGIKHRTSGLWHQPTITNIARNPLLVAMVCFPRRSMGEYRRYSAGGPREMEDSDYRQDGKPRVIRTDESSQIKTPVASKFEAIIEPERHKALIALLDKRGGTQRGKPRSRSPEKNPLGCRVIDMNCSWPMYRQPYKESFRYLCGLYQQSKGQKCAHNHVDGQKAIRFVLGCLRQRTLTPGFPAKLKEQFAERAAGETKEQPRSDIDQKQRALAEVSRKIEIVGRNLALADTPEQRKATADVFQGLVTQKKTLEEELAAFRPALPKGHLQEEVNKALNLALHLCELASAPDNLAGIGELFQKVNARLFVRFAPCPQGKRVLNKVSSGVATFGSAPAPCLIYQGPTAKSQFQDPGATLASGPDVWENTYPNPANPSQEEGSLGNVNRGDRIRTCDFMVPNHAL